MPNERPSDAEIRNRAYELYLERGGTSSSQDALEDWLRAEQEVAASAPAPIGKAASKNGRATEMKTGPAAAAPLVTPTVPEMAAATTAPAPKRSRRVAR